LPPWQHLLPSMQCQAWRCHLGDTSCQACNARLGFVILARPPTKHAMPGLALLSWYDLLPSLKAKLGTVARPLAKLALLTGWLQLTFT